MTSDDIVVAKYLNTDADVRPAQDRAVGNYTKKIILRPRQDNTPKEFIYKGIEAFHTIHAGILSENAASRLWITTVFCAD